MLLHISKEIKDNLYRIAVEDTGIGISENDQQQLFKLFTQVDNSSTKAFSGTGLGLAISKQLSSLMGGQIGVSSEPDSGRRESGQWQHVFRRCQPSPLPGSESRRD